MNSTTLQKEIAEAIPKLLNIARELTWNNISSNCKFILSEIPNTEDNFMQQWEITKKENERKVPLPLDELMPTLQQLYDNLYDINLLLYKAAKNETIIEIQYYLKSSLNDEFRQKIKEKPPMLHCKVAVPPWLSDRKEKFDINWRYNTWLWRWKIFWVLRKLKSNSG